MVSTNIATYFASQGLRVAIADIDPLSDISTLLDLKTHENIVTEKTAGLKLKHEPLTDHTLNIGKNFDLIFPRQKLTNEDRELLLYKIFVQHAADIITNYDVIVFDLPAGNELKDNLIYQDFINHILMVTNPEPTAHMSTGGYIKSSIDIDPKRIDKILLLHNKMSNNPTDTFNDWDVIGNYNKMSSENQIAKNYADQLQTIGEIPETNYLKVSTNNPLTDNILAGLINSLLTAIKNQQSHSEVVKGQMQATRQLLNKNEFQKANIELEKLLIMLQAQPKKDLAKLFILEIYYVLQKIKVSNKIASYIPKKKISTGNTIRNRHKQLMDIINGEHHSTTLANQLMPLVINQFSKLNKLNIPTPPQEIIKNVLEDFCEEALYSGLGVLAPLTIRTAARDFRQMADNLLKLMQISVP